MLKYNSNNLMKAKKLRKEMTPWEGKLWNIYLKNSNYKFYKQRLINNYIVDFYCPKARVAIELDGSQHRTEQNILYDIERTQKLNSLHIDVLRFSNIDIDKNLEGVILHINQIIKSKIKD